VIYTFLSLLSSIDVINKSPGYMHFYEVVAQTS
jgi:hypothetical protein